MFFLSEACFWGFWLNVSGTFRRNNPETFSRDRGKTQKRIVEIEEKTQKHMVGIGETTRNIIVDIRKKQKHIVEIDKKPQKHSGDTERRNPETCPERVCASNVLVYTIRRSLPSDSNSIIIELLNYARPRFKLKKH